MARGRFERNLMIFMLDFVNDGWDIFCEIALKWKSVDLTDNKSALVEVMVWCCQATSRYFNRCWSKFLSEYGITEEWWVNYDINWNDVVSIYQSGTNPNLVAKILATKFGGFFVIHVMF